MMRKEVGDTTYRYRKGGHFPQAVENPVLNLEYLVVYLADTSRCVYKPDSRIYTMIMWLWLLHMMDVCRGE